MNLLFFFFFQAEDGIRDVAVTGVQTCALPISHPAEMGSGVLAPLQRAEDKQDSQKWLSHSCAGAVAFFVFFAGAAGTWIVAADFRTGAHGLGRFGLRGAGLILQILLLALLFALELACHFRQALRT